MNVGYSFSDYLLFCIGVFNCVMSIFIFVNNPRNKVNIGFTVFSACLTFWTIFLLIFRNISLEYAALAMRLIYVAGLGAGVSLWWFVHNFPVESKIKLWYKKILIPLLIVIVLLFLWPNILVKQVTILPDTTRSVILNPLGYGIFVLAFSYFYLGGLIIFARRIRHVNALLKEQSILILIGVTVLVIFGGYFNIILPSPYLHDFHFIHLGPVFILFLLITVGLAIAKYQFMNIKVLITELYVIVLLLVLLPDIFLAKTFQQIIFRISILVTVILFSYLLIRSVLKEVYQKEALQTANLRLQDLDHQKNEFLSIAAHQLRTPLSILNGYLELIQDEAFGNKETEESLQALKNMDESNSRLTNLVNEFLDIARIEAGRTEFKFEKGDLITLISSVVLEVGPRAIEKKLRLVWNPVGTLTGTFDADKIRHVILNFVDNAIKYSSHGTITITAVAEEGGLCFRVTDQGIGFEETDRVNLFQKLFRGKNVEGTNVTGTGIGLYVCAKFIEAHGGRVLAKSPGLGRGSEFGFWIPLQPPSSSGTK